MSGSVRPVLAGAAILLLLPIVSARAQYGGGAPSGEKTPATSGAYPTPRRGDAGELGVQQTELFRDEDFVPVTPETGRLDTVLVRVGRAKRPLAYHRIRQDAPARFRIATLAGPTVLRIRVAFVADSERPPLTNGDLLVTLDSEPLRPFHVKVKRFRSASVSDSLRWISDPRVVDVLVPEGHHVVEVRAAEPDREVVGVFEMPIARAD